MRKMSFTDFCFNLPKIELHAHLNGSISYNTLRRLNELQKESNDEDVQELTNIDNLTTLEECFHVFSLIHTLTRTPDSIFLATCDVIKDFVEDGVIYLELRTTPRAVENSMTKEEYIETVLKAIRTCETQWPNILVKLLISVDRRQSYEAAEENVRLAMEYSKKYEGKIVGVDLSGDPTKGSAFLELLEKCRKFGLKITIHCAEVANETETMDILKFKPDRLGHCTCVHPTRQGTAKLFEELCSSKIPVELCLTSNVKCKTVQSYADHHFKFFHEAGHPICIATDDKGVFNTSLSKEFEIASTHFDLRKEELIEISRNSINFAFASHEEKLKLQFLLKSFELTLKKGNNEIE